MAYAQLGDVPLLLIPTARACVTRSCNDIITVDDLANVIAFFAFDALGGTTILVRDRRVHRALPAICASHVPSIVAVIARFAGA